MQPSIWSGDSISVYHVNLADIQPGAVVVFVRNRHFVVHRFVRRTLGAVGDMIVTRGDACLHDDLPVSQDEFLGVVARAARVGKNRSRKRAPAAFCGVARFVRRLDLARGFAHRALASLAREIARTVNAIAPRYLARSTSLAARVNDGGLAIMTPTHCAVVTLNEVAAAIWLAADGHTTLAEIVDHVVCGKFHVEPHVARRDAETFVGDLLRHGILVPGERPIVNAPAATLNEFAT